MKKFWFPILILLVLVAGSVLSIYWVCEPKDDNDEVGPVILSIFVWPSLMIYLIVWPSVYGSAAGKIARLKAFFEATKKAYEYTIQSTQEIEIKALRELSVKNKGGAIDKLKHLIDVDLGDLAYLKLGEETSERLRELREEVEEYNNKLAEYRRWNQLIITRGFVPEVPENLEFISF